jgi:hypothetical protein
VLLAGQLPNLASAVLARALHRLPGDYLAVYGQRVLAVVACHRAGSVAEPAAWLTTAMTNLCLNELASAVPRWERYVGTLLPELVLTGDQALGPRITSRPAAPGESDPRDCRAACGRIREHGLSSRPEYLANSERSSDSL